MNSDLNSRMTPYSVKYPSCALTFVRFDIYCGETSSHQRISSSLGFSPTDEAVKDDIVKTRGGRVRTNKRNYWGFSTRRKIESLDLRSHLDYLLKLLVPKKKELSELQAAPDSVMRVQCFWCSRGSGGPTLWPEQMKILADLNLELGIEVDLIDEDEQESWDVEDLWPD